jgi:fibronectin type 3 domain-containing protein
MTGTAALSWTAVAGAEVSGYRVYYGRQPGGYQQGVGAGVWAGNAAAFNATGLQKGTTYYFAVTAVDTTGRESAYSNEASKLVQ